MERFLQPVFNQLGEMKPMSNLLHLSSFKVSFLSSNITKQLPFVGRKKTEGYLLLKSTFQKQMKNNRTKKKIQQHFPLPYDIFHFPIFFTEMSRNSRILSSQAADDLSCLFFLLIPEMMSSIPGSQFGSFGETTGNEALKRRGHGCQCFLHHQLARIMENGTFPNLLATPPKRLKSSHRIYTAWVKLEANIFSPIFCCFQTPIASKTRSSMAAASMDVLGPRTRPGVVRCSQTGKTQRESGFSRLPAGFTQDVVNEITE